MTALAEPTTGMSSAAIPASTISWDASPRRISELTRGRPPFRIELASVFSSFRWLVVAPLLKCGAIMYPSKVGGISGWRTWSNVSSALNSSARRDAYWSAFSDNGEKSTGASTRFK